MNPELHISVLKASSFLLIACILILPIFGLWLHKRTNNFGGFFVYLLFSAITLTALLFLTAWWADKSSMIELNLLGYNHYGMNETELYANVSTSNIARVKSLEYSIMGIGWPLKAIFGIPLTLGYSIIVYMFNALYLKTKRT